MEPIVIAEIGWNHMGDMKLAKDMIKKAKESGASIAKFQTWQVSKLKKGEWDEDGRKEIYIKAELSKEKHELLIKYCDDYGILFMSSAFSVEDAELLKFLNCTRIKIPSFEINNIKLLNFCKANFNEIYISTGTANEKEIFEVKKLFSGWKGKLIVMHCVSAYPCKPNDINLPRINHLKNYFSNVGFSDHTQGIKTTISSINLSPVAIEKHFTIDKTLPGRDNKFAIIPEEMLFLTSYIKEMNLSMTDHGIDYQDIEEQSREFYRGRFDK